MQQTLSEKDFAAIHLAGLGKHKLPGLYNRTLHGAVSFLYAAVIMFLPDMDAFSFSMSEYAMFIRSICLQGFIYTITFPRRMAVFHVHWLMMTVWMQNA